MTGTTTPDDPAGPGEDAFEIPEFDPRRTRRAVRRGVLRTGLVAAVTLVLLFVAATAGSEWVQRRGDREKRMRDVLGTALQIANPGYRITLGGISASPLSLSLDVGITPLRAQGSFSTGAAFGDTKDEITQDFFGRVLHSPLGYATETPLTYALYNVGTGNQPKDRMRKVLARLPRTMNALAVVEFAAPLGTDQLAAFGRQYDSCPDLVVYENRPRATPITWGWDMSPSTSGMDGGTCHDLVPKELANFRAWVASLREYDDANLRRLGVNLKRLRESAAGGQTYAYVDTVATVEELRKIIEDPRVATVRVADVTYDLERDR
ncbi:hypothetical protein [Sphaerisporangium fuscum]|uniref:hypothetical protein n=1 Tax=Sphaerisporangium fuscum TaxID=2835868 RepID=UPI001BDDB96B|nr:hypothetical protein [Sphaerisporangium fuscum]